MHLKNFIGLTFFLLFQISTALAQDSSLDLNILTRKEWGAAPPKMEMIPQVPSAITIHHTATPQKPDLSTREKLQVLQKFSFSEGALGNGDPKEAWADIPYHFYIADDGTIAQGRKVKFEGDSNTDYDLAGHLLIVLEGNFEKENLTNDQFASLFKLVTYLAKEYHIPPENITGHKDQAPTACPGKNLYELLPLLRKKIKYSDFSRVVIGAEQLLTPKYLPLVQNKRIGLVTNHTGVLPNGQHLIDVLSESPKVNLTLLFGPEHGLRGEQDAPVANGRDPKTGLRIISLYGKRRKPSSEMLKTIDVLIFDIQDIGARYYTYIKTMLWVMEAAAESEVPFIILDRPNPIGGQYVDGPVAPIAKNGNIPITHGMTVGELALMFNANRKRNNLPMTNLSIIPMKNYSRGQWYNETGLPWIKPSPNMLSLKTATVYPATCLIEGTNISEGRGTMHPFEQFGAPWINGEELAAQLNSYHLAGATFKPTHFVPDSIVDGIKIYPPKFLGETCKGVEMIITNRNTFQSAKAGIYILHALMTLYPELLELKKGRLDGLLDTPEVRKKLQAGIPPEEIVACWKPGLEKFIKKRKKYLIYPQ